VVNCVVWSGTESEDYQRIKSASPIRVRVRDRTPMFAIAPVKLHVSPNYSHPASLKLDGTTEQQLANI